jgi:hypothetical protein
LETEKSKVEKGKAKGGKEKKMKAIGRQDRKGAAIEQAKQYFEQHKDDEDFLAGIKLCRKLKMHKRKRIELCSWNAEVLKSSWDWIVAHLNPGKKTGVIFLPDNIDIEFVKAHWRSSISEDIEFLTPQVRPHISGKEKSGHGYGSLVLAFGSGGKWLYLKERLDVWMEMAKHLDSEHRAQEQMDSALSLREEKLKAASSIDIDKKDG